MGAGIGPPPGEGAGDSPGKNTAAAQEIDRKADPAPGRGLGGSANYCEIAGPAQQAQTRGLAAATGWGAGSPQKPLSPGKAAGAPSFRRCLILQLVIGRRGGSWGLSWLGVGGGGVEE